MVPRPFAPARTMRYSSCVDVNQACWPNKTETESYIARRGNLYFTYIAAPTVGFKQCTRTKTIPRRIQSRTGAHH